jgi:hypothetical protein
MKKILLSVSVVAALAILVAACSTNPVTVQPVLNSDTTGLAQFNEWKTMEAQTQVARQYNAAYTAGRKSVQAKTYSMKSESTHEAKVTKKKGWSKSAKYAAFGAAGGGVLGAVINKRNRVAGGVIGAVVLGGGGYIFGRSQDKKDGRF